MERFFTKSILLISLLILIPNISRADAVYKWNDALGRVHFGSNPPKDAKNVDPIKNKRVSRYSSKKLIEHYSPNASKNTIAEETINIDDSAPLVVVEPETITPSNTSSLEQRDDTFALPKDSAKTRQKNSEKEPVVEVPGQ